MKESTFYQLPDGSIVEVPSHVLPAWTPLAAGVLGAAARGVGTGILLGIGTYALNLAQIFAPGPPGSRAVGYRDETGQIQAFYDPATGQPLAPLPSR
jgi:hypothetical protein